ncbi:hypothetical protein TVAG_496240 [Trichomonas vaginalis G3]|uniref:Uncharacterized protein n=1 Tax=Trichomonas vaginalis (strain ATCC PRA-98 / G3) TaxID=412133 RepID=A2FR74_TRIV3|nr:conserved domain protein family [Trichomonas vaginalis G3]EAX92590.1 hypothetical protein TVAG_496240 [Trichomonas vaginalis G3]KAI5533833.1 conserved domain protein family [Trichomonas vaginalis G3]|eukprot:XP_001305520.1 hypothetical protein [Trichomonas vaginalis G3]
MSVQVFVYPHNISTYIDAFNKNPSYETAVNLAGCISPIIINNYPTDFCLSISERLLYQFCKAKGEKDRLDYIYFSLDHYIYYLRDRSDSSSKENLVDKIINGTDGTDPFTFSQVEYPLKYIEEHFNLKLIHMAAQLLTIYIINNCLVIDNNVAYYIEKILPFVKLEIKKKLATKIIPQGKISQQHQSIQMLCYLLARYTSDRIPELKEYISNNLKEFLKNKDLISIIQNIKDINKNDYQIEECEVYSKEIRQILEIYQLFNLDVPNNYEATIIEFIKKAKKYNFINEQDNLYIIKVFPSLIDKGSLIYLDSEKIIELFVNLPSEGFELKPFFEVMKNREIVDDTNLSIVFDKILSNMDYKTEELLIDFALNHAEVQKPLTNSIKNFIYNYDVEKMKIMPVFMITRLYPILEKPFPDADLEYLIYDSLPSYYILSNLVNLGESYKLSYPEKLVQFVPPSPALFTYLSNHVTDYSNIISWSIEQTCEYKEYFDLLINIWQQNQDPNIAWKIYQLFDVFERECDDSILESIQNAEPNVILEKMCSNSAEFLASWLDLFDLSGIDPKYLYNKLNEHPYLLFLANRLDEKFNFVFDQKLFSEMKNNSNIFKAFILDSALQIAPNEWWNLIKKNPEILKLNFTENDFKKSMIPISSTICNIFLKCLMKIEVTPDSDFANDSFILGVKNLSMDLCDVIVDYIKVDERILECVFSQDNEQVCYVLLDHLDLKELSVTALEYASNATLIPLVEKERQFISDENLINKLPFIKRNENYEKIVSFIIESIAKTQENYLSIFDLLFSTKFTKFNRKSIAKIIFKKLPDARWLDSFLNLHDFGSFLREHAIPVIDTMNQYLVPSILVLSTIPFVVNNFDEISPLSRALLQLSLTPSSRVNIYDLDLSMINNFPDFETTFSYLLSLIPNNGSFDFIQQLLLDEFSYHFRELTKSNLLFFELKFSEPNKDFLTTVLNTHINFKNDDILSEELKRQIGTTTSAKYISAPKVICYKLSGDVPNGMTIPQEISNPYCLVSTNYQLCGYIAQDESNLSTYIIYNHTLLKFNSVKVEIRENTDSSDKVLYAFYIREDLANQEIKHQLHSSEDLVNSSISFLLSDKDSIDWSDMKDKPNADQLSITLKKQYYSFNLFNLLNENTKESFDSNDLEHPTNNILNRQSTSN